MTNPTADHLAWLQKHRVWGLLRAENQQALLEHGQLQRWASDSSGYPAGSWGQRLHVIVSGQVQLHDNAHQRKHTLLEGESFGAAITPPTLVETCSVQANTDTLLLVLDIAVLHRLLQDEPALEIFFPLPFKPMHQSVHSRMAMLENDMFNLPLAKLVQRTPITLPPNASVLEAAQLMRQEGVSSVMLTEAGALLGVVTDRDLRNRVVAQGLPLATALRDIASMQPLSLSPEHAALEAMLLMVRHNIHHLPVVAQGEVRGMVTATDLHRQNDLSAIYMARDIQQQNTLEGLVNISRKLRPLQQHLAAANASAYTTGHVITTLTDAFTQRLIQLAESNLGPAPVPFVWVAAGSQARNEQTAKSDQDNCMILDDSYKAEIHGDYFSALARQVCDGLDACGYIHCPGEMMAMTSKWRQPLQQWRHYFRHWVNQPEPMSLMLTSVFFDMRAVYGATHLMDDLRRDMLKGTRGNSLFLAHMVSNAQKLRPPLGLFGGISLIRSGEHAGTIDLKHNGLAPIVDLARIYALAGGLVEVNTHDRLEKAADSGEVSAQSARDLRDALEFLSALRITHQTERMQAGLEANNFLDLHELSNFERTHLKNAFSVIQSLQAVLGQRYHF